MIPNIRVDASEPSIARLLPGYNGRDVSIRPGLTDEPFRFQGSYWDGGSRTDYTVVDIATGKSIDLPGINPLRERDERQAVIPRGYAVIEHSVFCGKHQPPQIWTHPGDLTPALPRPAELPEALARCLIATASLKNTYGGETGIRQKRSGLTPEEWTAAQAECLSRGLLNRAGAITREGRNAVDQHPLRHRIS